MHITKHLEITEDHIKYRFFAGCYDGEFVAINPDLDIIGTGDTPQEAEEAMIDSILCYLLEAVKSEKSNQLIPRRTPFSRRLRYKYYCWRARVLRRVHPLDNNKPKDFCPVPDKEETLTGSRLPISRQLAHVL
jgi:hypothetical protein